MGGGERKTCDAWNHVGRMISKKKPEDVSESRRLPLGLEKQVKVSGWTTGTKRMRTLHEQGQARESLGLGASRRAPRPLSVVERGYGAGKSGSVVGRKEKQ